MDKAREHIARGIVCKDGKILLCKNIAGGYCFLPGGHVEENESSKEALEREFLEESGTAVTVIRYVGSFHNEFESSGKTIQEVLDIHLIKIENDHVESKEGHIGFSWIPLKEIHNTRILPEKLIPEIVSIVKENEDIWK